MPTLAVLLVLFAFYVLLVTWQMRRAVRAPEGPVRLREARRLLILVTAGAPLAIAFLVLL